MIKYLDLRTINNPYEHAADEMLRSGWYLRGDYTRRFEEAYAEYIGTRHCIGCGNGLDALTLIFRAYREMGVMQDGDEVIVPANTYIASILSITENNLKPVLVEPSLDTLQIDDALIEQAITERTRAIMIVHLYGRCAYTARIGDLCRKYNLKLIEDNAQAHGCRPTQALPKGGMSDYQTGAATNAQNRAYVDKTASYVSRHPSLGEGLGGLTGSLGHAAAHSFYPTKNLGAFGDAGAVTTDDADLAALIRALGNYGSARHYVFDHIGRNSRMDEVQAAILLAKLPHLDAANQRRREIAARYEREVSNDAVRILLVARDSVYHIFPVLSPRRDELQRYLADNGVQTEIHYPIPPHKQKCYEEWNARTYPITELIHAQELSIPCHQALTDGEVSQIITLLNTFK